MLFHSKAIFSNLLKFSKLIVENYKNNFKATEILIYEDNLIFLC